MRRDPSRGLIERCDICGRESEVDDAEDARCWALGHYAAFHEWAIA